MAIIKRVQYIEIPDEEYEEVKKASPFSTEEHWCAEACWSVNAIITHEELSTYEEFCMEV